MQVIGFWQEKPALSLRSLHADSGATTCVREEERPPKAVWARAGGPGEGGRDEGTEGTWGMAEEVSQAGSYLELSLEGAGGLDKRRMFQKGGAV